MRSARVRHMVCRWEGAGRENGGGVSGYAWAEDVVAGTVAFVRGDEAAGRGRPARLPMVQ